MHESNTGTGPVFLLVAVVVEWIVAGKGKEHAKARTQREEDL